MARRTFPTISRRRFLQLAGGGTALALSSAAFSGCAAQGEACDTSAGTQASTESAPMDTLSRATPDVLPSLEDKLQGLRTDAGFMLLWISDSHAKQGDDRLEHAYENIDTAFQVAEQVAPDAILHTGDIVDGSGDLDEYRGNVDDVVALAATSPVPFLAARGNHDDNSYYTCNVTGRFARDEVEDTAYIAQNLIRPAGDAGCVYDGEAPQSCYFYRDFPASKVRVIVLDTNDNPYTTHGDGTLDYTGIGMFGIGSRQVAWFAEEALGFSEGGWAVIVASHVDVADDRPYGLNSWGTAPSVANGEQLWNVLLAFASRSKGHTVNDAQDFACDVSYDFTQSPSNEVICCLNGHIHRDNCAFLDGIFCATIRQLTSRDTACIDALVVDRARRQLHFRTYDMPTGQPVDWDIDLDAQTGVPETQEFYYGKTIADGVTLEG